MAGSSCPGEQALAAFAEGAPDASIEAHLNECARCREAVTRARRDAVTSIATRRLSGDWRASAGAEVEQVACPDPLDLPRLGDVIAAKYRVDGILGRGGMGVVLSARHLELGHRVAIKILRSNDAHAAERFLREAQTAVQLKGERIVRVFDLGRLSAGSPYFVMELLDGEDLAQLLKRGPVPVATAVQYLLEICEALEEAHAAGVVHRDLKPANLFLVRNAHIKVLDFGLSKWLQPDDDVALGITAKHDVMGSPLYMSPEQVRASRDVDEKTDLWSLGVILYELVSGRLPFAAGSTPAIAVQIATAAPEPLPEAPELEPIIFRCLEKDPSKRHVSVAAFAAALRDLPGPREQPRPGVRRSVTIGVGLVLAATALGAFWFASTRQPPAIPTPAPHAEAPTPPAPEPQPSAAPAPQEPRIAGDQRARKPQEKRRTPKSDLDIGEILPP